MPHISEAKHYQLVKHLLSMIEAEQLLEQNQNGLPFKEDLQKITMSFSAYKSEITKIHFLISEYDQIYKRTKMHIRRYRRSVLT